MILRTCEPPCWCICVCNQLYQNLVRQPVLRLLLFVYVYVHVFLVLRHPVIRAKLCNRDCLSNHAPRVKTQRIPKPIEAATHQINIQSHVLCVFCLILAVLASSRQAPSCYIMLVYITRSQARHAHRNSPLDRQIWSLFSLGKHINTNITDIGRLVNP